MQVMLVLGLFFFKMIARQSILFATFPKKFDIHQKQYSTKEREALADHNQQTITI